MSKKAMISPFPISKNVCRNGRGLPLSGSKSLRGGGGRVCRIGAEIVEPIDTAPDERHLRQARRQDLRLHAVAEARVVAVAEAPECLLGVRRAGAAGGAKADGTGAGGAGERLG